MWFRVVGLWVHVSVGDLENGINPLTFKVQLCFCINFAYLILLSKSIYATYVKITVVECKAWANGEDRERRTRLYARIGENST